MHLPSPSRPRLPALFLALSLTAAAAAQHAKAPYVKQPLPTHPSALTQVAFDARFVEWCKTLLITSYRKHGRTDSKWDTDMERLLSLFGELMGRSIDKATMTAEDEPLRDYLFHVARPLHEKGCDDPLLAFVTGALLYSLDATRTRPLLEQAARGLQERGYPAILSYFVTTRLRGVLAALKEDTKVEGVLATELRLLTRAAADDCFDGQNQRFYLRLAATQWVEAGGDVAQRFMDALRQVKDAKRYIVLTLRGRHHIKKAWAARGNDIASKVKDEAWAVFFEELAKARHFLLQAHRLHPEFPEAPTSMIQLAMAGAEPKDPRYWFDRAVAAQVDHEPAYRRYIWALMPRWTGSHEAMIAFGRECVDTKRFDTVIPDAMRAAALQVTRDFADSTEAFEYPGINEGLERSFTGYMMEPQARIQQYGHRTHRALVLYKAGRHAEAATFYQELGRWFDTTQYRIYRTTEKEFLAKIQPHLEAHVPHRLLQIDLYEGHEKEQYTNRYQAKPIAADSSAFCTQRYRDDRAGWTARFLVDQYRTYGSRNTKWDDTVASALEDWATLTTRRQDTTLATKFAERVADLRRQQCDDPLVSYLSARAIMMRGAEKYETEKALAEGWAGLQKSRYSRLIVFYAGRRLQDALRSSGDKAGATALESSLVDLLAAAASEDWVRDGKQRFLLDEMGVGGAITVNDCPRLPALAKALAATSGADPWIRSIVVGLDHMVRAHAASDSDYIWSREVRAAFREETDQARTCLHQAYKLRPDHPEAASALILLSALDPSPTTPREWFERAVASQFDFAAAYTNFAWSLHPDLGGSKKLMFKFGAECLATGRFDTNVPWELFRTIWSLSKIQGEPRLAWASPTAWTAVETMCDGLIGKASQRNKTYYESLKAVLAWATGRYDVADQRFTKLGKQFDEQAYAALGVDKELVQKDLQAIRAAAKSRSSDHR